jgi:hypothetical protein
VVVLCVLVGLFVASGKLRSALVTLVLAALVMTLFGKSKATWGSERLA